MNENTGCEVGKELPRFPCEQIEYTKTVGRLLPAILGEVLTKLGFKVKVNPQQQNGVDMEVFLGDNLVLVAEILNWSISSRLTDKRKSCIIRNLNKFNCSKVLIYTVPLSNLNGLIENGIPSIDIGYQVLPEPYYSFFQMKRQTEKRNIDSDSTRRNIRTKILEYIDQHLFAHGYMKLLIAPDNSARNN